MLKLVNKTMVEDKLKTIELAQTLLVARASAYWNQNDGSGWSLELNDETWLKIYNSCLNVAKLAVKEGLEYING